MEFFINSGLVEGTPAAVSAPAGGAAPGAGASRCMPPAPAGQRPGLLRPRRPCPATPRARQVAEFLRRHAEQVDKAALGELLGHHSEMAISVRRRAAAAQSSRAPLPLARPSAANAPATQTASFKHPYIYPPSPRAHPHPHPPKR
jgi:hypothetical protein